MSYRKILHAPVGDTAYSADAYNSTTRSGNVRPRKLSRGIHWRAPAIMCSSLVAGFAFILGHHFFYQSLHHSTVPNSSLQQQINTGVGTAFAFLVRMFLVISVASAYWQLFWRQVKAKPTAVSKLDSLSGILENALEFFSVKTMAGFPLLALLAVISWLIPIAVVFPPGALTVELSPFPNVTTESVQRPVIDFNRNEFAQIQTIGSNPGHFKVFAGPRYRVQQIGQGVASSGQILQFADPYVNSSYELKFMAPALQCSNIEGDMGTQFNRNISSRLNCNIDSTKIISKPAALGPWCSSRSMYIAWAPTEKRLVDFQSLNDTNPSKWTGWYGNTLGQFGVTGRDEEVKTPPAALFLAFQQTLDNSLPWSFLNCSFYNASYHITVNYTSGTQRVDVKKNITEGIGYVELLDNVGTASDDTVDPITGESAFMTTTMAHMAYQALMDMFGRLFAGQISVSNWQGQTVYSNVTSLATSVLATSLADTEEMSMIKQIVEVCNGGNPACMGQNQTLANLNITGVPTGLPKLARSAEQLFENMTLSLFSDKRFLSLSDASPKTQVTTHSSQNRYVYTPWQLLVPYLVSLLFVLLTTAIGAHSLLLNGLSYTQDFSTILRTTRNAELRSAQGGAEVILDAQDKTGADPIAEHVETAIIDFRSQSGSVGLVDTDSQSQLGASESVTQIVKSPKSSSAAPAVYAVSAFDSSEGVHRSSTV